MNNNIITLVLDDLIGLIYPKHCVSCKAATRHNKDFCISCLKSLSMTDHFANKENELVRRLGQRITIRHGAALYNFNKRSKIRKAIHAIKYKGRQDLAINFGEQFGRLMVASPTFGQIDWIIPIPLHKQRLKTRGFNQSLAFSKGIASVTDIKILDNLLMKLLPSETLTKKNRSNRFMQVKDSYQLNDPQRIANKSILIVDDVLTTGATIEAACDKLSKYEPKEVYLGLMSLAQM